MPAHECERRASVNIDHVAMREFDDFRIVHRNSVYLFSPWLAIRLAAILRSARSRAEIRYFRTPRDDFRADPGAGENFEQHRVPNPSIDYMCLGDAFAQRVDAAFDFRNHAFVNHAARD